MTIPRLLRKKLSLDELAEAHALYLSIYARSGVGCCWHVVLEDKNVEDSMVNDIAKEIREIFSGSIHGLSWNGKEIVNPILPTSGNCLSADCLAITPLLIRMSTTQRLKLARGGYAKLLRGLFPHPPPISFRTTDNGSYTITRVGSPRTLEEGKT